MSASGDGHPVNPARSERKQRQQSLPGARPEKGANCFRAFLLPGAPQAAHVGPLLQKEGSGIVYRAARLAGRAGCIDKAPARQ